MEKSLSVSEVAFAQQLGSNVKKERSTALKKLKLAVNHMNDPKEENMMKLWAGLYYCMYMADKREYQNDLGDKISRLIHEFPSIKVSIMYLKCFFATILREWHLIDKFRLDKFLAFIRKMIRETFVLIRSSDFDDELIQEYKTNMESIWTEEKNIAVYFQVIFVYVDELERVFTDTIPMLDSAKFVKVLSPVITVALQGKNRKTFENIKEDIIERLLHPSPIYLTKSGENDGNPGNEDVRDIYRNHFKALADYFFSVASTGETTSPCRRNLYRFKRAFEEKQQSTENKMVEDVTTENKNGAVEGENESESPSENEIEAPAPAVEAKRKTRQTKQTQKKKVAGTKKRKVQH